MALELLQTEAGARAAAAAAFDAMAEMFPICRSITGDGVRRTFDLIERIIPLERHEVATGTAVFDWEVPREWNIRDAWIADRRGRRVVDFRDHTLHVVSYSTPVRRTMSLDELQPHLYSLPEQPELIPYRTSYYNDHWGFCMRHRDRERLEPGPYEVVIDSDLTSGHLSYAECVVPGSGAGEAIVYTHTCHPSLANDNLSGIALAAQLARELRKHPPRLTWRFVFGPGTIGSLTWLARNEVRLSQLVAGLVIGSLGDSGPLTYKRSRRGATATDRAAEHALAASALPSRVMDFEPYGYDERQFCSPGFDLPIGRLTRSPNGGYAEYHTSADSMSLVHPERLAESLQVLARIVSALDCNRRPLNLSGKGEPRLGKRGLYGSLGGASPGEVEHALLWVLSLADGEHDLVAMASRSGLGIDQLDRATGILEQAGLVRMLEEATRTEPSSRDPRSTARNSGGPGA
jgi:aminopeptidase-like protein